MRYTSIFKPKKARPKIKNACPKKKFLKFFFVEIPTVWAVFS